jgi:hypothetical protein
MKAYLYLAKRNKKGTKLIARFNTSKEVASRIENIAILNLPSELENKIKKIVEQNKMSWELWVETANSYELLKESLRKRGYTDISIHPVPMIMDIMPTLNAKKISKPPKSMIQRGKH